MMRLDERARRTETVIARYRTRPFDWAKARTCAHLARAQMRALGHRPPPLPAFRSAISARTALTKKMGFPDLAAWLDSLLPRIAPAEMIVGDLALMEGGGFFDAIVIATGAGDKVIGYHDDHLARGVVNIVASEYLGAWRV